MSSSFRKIDYRLRPAKAVERRMMAEAFLRLREFRSVESFQYIGMGSVYFSDFSLFHSVCGFESMISIENSLDPKIQARFKINVPHSRITMKFGHSNDVVPLIDWSIPSVAWLDYDGVFDASVCRDVVYIASNAAPVSMLCVSVNCALRDEEEGKLSKSEVLKSRLGAEAALPAKYEAGGSIDGKDVPGIYREILQGLILGALGNRNAGRAAGNHIQCKQVFYFTYNDGAPMVTLGWVFCDKGQSANLSKCGFDELQFYRPSDVAFNLALPLVTNHEVRLINRMQSGDSIPLPPSEIANYEALRRYWPTFASVELL